LERLALEASLFQGLAAFNFHLRALEKNMAATG
jgi:hypothetical protein